MSTIYKRIVEVLEAEQAFGYQTSFTREELNLAKSHHNDAFVIAGGETALFALAKRQRVLPRQRLRLELEGNPRVGEANPKGTTQKRAEPLMLEQIRRHKRSLEQFYDAKYIDLRSGEKVSGSTLNSGRRTRNKNLNGENLRMYRGLKVSIGQRRVKKQRYPYNPNDYVKFEDKVYRVIGMQNLGTGVQIADYPGVVNKVVNVNKVQPIKRRSGLCASTKIDNDSSTSRTHQPNR